MKHKPETEPTLKPGCCWERQVTCRRNRHAAFQLMNEPTFGAWEWWSMKCWRKDYLSLVPPAWTRLWRSCIAIRHHFPRSPAIDTRFQVSSNKLLIAVCAKK